MQVLDIPVNRIPTEQWKLIIPVWKLTKKTSLVEWDIDEELQPIEMERNYF